VRSTQGRLVHQEMNSNGFDQEKVNP
jgi:hypothetical protein